jgi:hypothetical protein
MSPGTVSRERTVCARKIDPWRAVYQAFGERHRVPHTRVGRVWRTTLRFANDRARVEGAFDVTYRASAGLDVLLPNRFWEWLRTPDPEARGRLAYVEGQASYTNIRRFAVRHGREAEIARAPGQST